MAQTDILSLIAARTPDKTALVDDRPGRPVDSLTYAELDAEVNRLANALLARGVRPGEKVIWCGPNSIPVVQMMCAARKLGVTAVPLNYRLSPEETAYVVDHSDAIFAFIDSDHAALFEGIRPQISKVRDIAVYGGAPAPGMLDAAELLATASDAAPAVETANGEAATMIYTSGTTGKPKGALRRSLGDRSQVSKLIELIGYRPDDVFLTTGPLYHSGPGGFTQVALGLGNTVIIQRKFDAEDWLRLVDRYGVTTTFSAPTPIRMVCNLPAETIAPYRRGSMKRMVANAAPWSMALKRAYLARFPEDSLWEVYGSTELGVNTVLAPADQQRKEGSCGRPAPTVEIKLFDEHGAEVTRPHEPGELFVRGKTVFDTYYKAREKYEEDRRGAFHTVGDIAYFDEDGYFYICDRKKDMIISGGMNVYPAEIEAGLESHPDIADVAVFGIPDEDWGESVHAVVVARTGQGLTADDVIAFARLHLAGYKIPRSVAFADEIPRTGSGKILKRALREPFWRGHDRSVL